MAAEPPKAPERPENSAPFRCGSGVIGALRPLDGEITCTATPQLRSSWVRVRIVRSWRLLPARGTCDATSVCKTAFPRTKQAGVASPQPLTLTLVTPVCAPLVHLVRAIERRAPLRGRNPRRRKCRRAGSRDLHSLRPTVTTPKGAVASRDTPAIRSGAHPINNIGHVLPDRRRRSRRRARVGEASALDIGR